MPHRGTWLCNACLPNGCPPFMECGSIVKKSICRDPNCWTHVTGVYLRYNEFLHDTMKERVTLSPRTAPYSIKSWLSGAAAACQMVM